MHFVYEGFTHKHEIRCFRFRGVEERNPVSTFDIELDLPLFLENHVPVQEGPMFCLQLLTNASLNGATCLEGFHNYRILAEDLRPLLMERERRAAEKAMKKSFHRPIQKPTSDSNIQLTASLGGR